jgi:hypothetical protein
MYVYTYYTYMSNYQWYLTEKRKKLLEEIEKIPDYGKKNHAEIIEMALEEFYKVHKEGNPIHRLDDWTQNPEFIAIPALLAPKEQRNKWIQLQIQKKNWKDLTEIKYTLQEWQAKLKGVV